MEEKEEYQYKIVPAVYNGYDGFLYSNYTHEYYRVVTGCLTQRGCKRAIIKYLKKQKKIEQKEIQRKFLTEYGIIKI